jgi:acetyl esterase/lipase
MFTSRYPGAPGRGSVVARRRRRGLTAVGAAVVLAASACTGAGSNITKPPPGMTAGRYKTQVFNSVQKTANLQYGTIEGTNLQLDLYRPAGDQVTKRPALVWAHGGAFVAGSKDADPATNLAQDFAKLGYVTVSINYRLITGTICTGLAITPACRTAVINSAHDAQAAVRWLRKNADQYGIDPDRIGMSGDSAGAVLATAVGMAADDPGTSGNPGYPSDIQAWVAISGGLPPQDATERADAGDAPGLLFTGTSDFIVPSNWSTATANALKAKGVPAEVVAYQGAGHVPLGQINDIWPKTVAWFYKYLDIANAAQ